jgi:hypothetical protein
MHHYKTPLEADRVFGANHEAFSETYEGASICNPHYDHNEMEKAVRWAIRISSDSEIPCLTTFILPWYHNDKSTYLKYMAHPLVHSVAIIPKGNFKFRGEKLASKWDMGNIFYVANEQGIQKFVQPNLEIDLLAAIQSLTSKPISRLRNNGSSKPVCRFRVYAPIKYEVIRQGPSNEVVEVGPTASCTAATWISAPPQS